MIEDPRSMQEEYEQEMWEYHLEEEWDKWRCEERAILEVRS